MSTPGRAELVAALRQLLAVAPRRVEAEAEDEAAAVPSPAVTETATGITPAEAARRAGVSEASMSRYLAGRVVPSPQVIQRIVDALSLGETDEGREAINRADEVHAGEASRVVLLRPGSATLQARYAELEAAAGRIAAFAPALVHGLLQTAPYAQVVLGSTGRPEALVSEQVIDRMARQAILEDPAHHVTLLMTEGAWRQQVGSADEMAAQLEQVAERAGRDTGGRVRIGVIDMSIPVDRFPMAGFDIFDDRYVVIGVPSGQLHLDKPLDVRRVAGDFDRLCEIARWGPAAAAVARRIADEYRALATP